MGSDWTKLSVGEFADVVGGGTPKTKVDHYWGGLIPWITPKDLSSHEGRYISNGQKGCVC